jgi:hypothetical protein
MNRRKEIINEYKKRKLCGGVYTITNTLSGKYLIGHTANPNTAPYFSTLQLSGVFLTTGPNRGAISALVY